MAYLNVDKFIEGIIKTIPCNLRRKNIDSTSLDNSMQDVLRAMKQQEDEFEEKKNKVRQKLKSSVRRTDGDPV